MFSTSMIASSTTSPSAITKPPSTMMLSETPCSTSTMIEASSDKGMAVADTNAVRALNKKRNSTATTSAEPMRISRCTLPIEVSMKLAGRNNCVCTVKPSRCKSGRNWSRRDSTASVVAYVLAPS